MKPKGDKLNELLADKIERAHRRYRLTTVLISMTVLLGLSWLSFSAYHVFKQEQETSQLNAQIRKQATELDELRSSNKQARDELAAANQKMEGSMKALNEAEAALRNIALGKANPKAQAQQALQEMSKAANSNDTPGSDNANTAPVQMPGSQPTPAVTPATNSTTFSMPDVVGLSEKEAFSKLEGMQLNVRGTEIISNCKAHIVYDQTPRAGTLIKAGDFVQIFYCSGK